MIAKIMQMIPIMINIINNSIESEQFLTLFSKYRLAISIVECFYSEFIIGAMYVINNQAPQSDKCQTCNSVQIENIGTQAYCVGCGAFVSNLQYELKVVPQAYKSNSQQKPHSSQAIALKQVLELAQSFGVASDEAQVKFLTKETLWIHEIRGKRSKGHRQNAAAVVYCQLASRYKLSAKEFCKANQIKLKCFNQRYILYLQHMKNKKEEERLDLTKRQDKVKAESEGEDDQDNQDNQARTMDKLENPRQRLEKLFSCLFPKECYELHRSSIIETLLKEINEINRTLSISFLNLPELATLCKLPSELRMLYLIFPVLKKLDYKISLVKYRSLIKESTDYVLRQRIILAVKKYYFSRFQQQNFNERIDSHEVATTSEICKLQNP